MQVLSVCSTKGGSGKTTLATALAVASSQDQLRVALIDIDPQQSLAMWWEDRGKPDNPELITWKSSLGIRFLPTAIERTAQLGFDLVIIDTPPAILGIVEAGVEVSDFVLIPTQASSVDLMGNQEVIKMMEKHNKDFAIVINRAEARDPMVAEAMKLLKEFGPVITVTVGNRRAFRAAIGQGKAGPEVDAEKSKAEIASLWSAVKRRLRAQARKVA
ncbi:MAG: hypothetical protein APF80_12475 [Alphaproteobacteria bacterium BRH_c36]|nr:MAG: hypothetical protein APF80_12475 [Alphaproteobacteria bacterium BRH_c36]